MEPGIHLIPEAPAVGLQITGIVIHIWCEAHAAALIRTSARESKVKRCVRC